MVIALDKHKIRLDLLQIGVHTTTAKTGQGSTERSPLGHPLAEDPRLVVLSYRFLDTLQKAADNFEPIYRAPPNAKLWTGQFTQIFFDFSTQNQTYLF